MKIYTKTGDKGQTSLASGQRINKNDVRIEAYGTIDELNSFVGMIRNFEVDAIENKLLEFVQNRLFDIGSILATKKDGAKYDINLREICQSDIEKLEQYMDDHIQNLPNLKGFVIPAGSELISWCNICRTVCRRAERQILSIETDVDNFDEICIFINRLSDLLFVMGRVFAKKNNVEEILWNKDL